MNVLLPGYSTSIRLSILLLIILTTVLFPRYGNTASGGREITGIRITTAQGHTKITVDIGGRVEVAKRRLTGPDRLVFDLKGAVLSKRVKSAYPVNDGILRQVRAAQFDPETVRIVLDMDRAEGYEAFYLDDPKTLIIDTKGAASSSRSMPQSVAKRVIVLDPGHGGHDPGAVGLKGLKEKDVVLDVALKVKELLGEDEKLDIVLTRDSDVFIPLPDRTALARKKDADLFVSIHANASPRRAARGVETYLLNWTNQEEAIRVAARENYVSVKTMKDRLERYRKDNEVDIIKSDLRRQHNNEESVALANYVQHALYTDASRVNRKTANLGVKGALFFVLFGIEMPSILAEVSFISNPEEEKLLAKESYRTILAHSIASGIRTYLSASSAPQKVALSGVRP